MQFGTFPGLTGRPEDLKPLLSGITLWALKPGEPLTC